MGAYEDAGQEARERRERHNPERDAWQKQQEQVWGEGPEFGMLVKSIHDRNDKPGRTEADDLVRRMVESGSSAADVADAVVQWALAEVPSEGAFSRAHERYRANREWLIGQMDGPGYPSGSPLAVRLPHGTVHTVVNCLLRGRTGPRS